jgi:hypothetical protein
MKHAVWIALALSSVGSAQSTTADEEFTYRAREHDTLIGISRRLLTEPRRWPEVQARNHIANPRRIPLGDAVRIPYAWLRLSPETVTVAVVSGEVTQGTNNITAGQTLAQGSEIRTGGDGSVTLLLPDGSAVTLQKSSVLRLEMLRHVTGLPAVHDTRLKLQSGRLQTGVKPQGNMGRFEIQTPVAVSAVRGTEFRGMFGPDTGTARTETLGGVVAVTGAGGKEVPVPADFGTRVERDSPPLPPRQLLPPPDLQALSGRNGAARLRLQWPAVSGAASYRVQLAPDPEFQSFLVDTESTNPKVDVPAPADGDYWLRVRSIDELGLEGRDAVEPLVQHQLPAAPALNTPAPGTEVIGAGTAFTWSAGEPGVGYRLQIARDADFTDVFVTRECGEVTHLELPEVPAGHYFWRIAGVDAKGEAGEWSAAREYSQRLPAPTPAPPTFVHREMQFHWDPQARVRYHIQLAHDSGFKRLVFDRTVDSPAAATHRPRPGLYYARVQTIAEDGSAGPFGATRRFTVSVPLWVEIVVPLVLILPAVL